ncbi:MAG: hypothetical protein A2W61_07275 [Deltaproteobacteria bacterium RIFCSPLOWO2_01_44_7]|nr:MAG: hypothetical protein A2712_07925 [Deltaproteobacteria bacterium RIFCSPHIGHO2_01_FULL_43_49]OGQ14732.1 MAG: hypothetical protein A3D22_09070 [Deltaproteobacteria bacterium RIFCSPHIGHO2_02_FULL_44_53]OGQ28118.1 MAG: hypothetical protein A3D98_07780 [Deltaproteobacteria bacterium RIFCSPHIGHO2_12_FULL_44_21]OGQ31330.1 MAG: hypothetical protein A2979_07830 [Deltaproteobacteria bacterium RIFCSPLOWO2_01_FULL_45_74]OGQ40791.1 MAG: hypothetical protein A2W61_07275 [Deltaproteobacteria bacterium 
MISGGKIDTSKRVHHVTPPRAITPNKPIDDKKGEKGLNCEGVPSLVIRDPGLCKPTAKPASGLFGGVSKYTSKLRGITEKREAVLQGLAVVFSVSVGAPGFLQACADLASVVGRTFPATKEK